MRLLTAILLLASGVAQAQFGQYQSLELPSGTHTAALGGKVISLVDGELMQFMNNPATLEPVLPSEVAVSYNPYFADVSVLSGAYYPSLGKLGPMAFGVTYLNYGDFEERDASGNKVGSFRAGDYVIALGKSHTAGPFTVGVNLKTVHSFIESYSSTLMVFDVGGVYQHPEKNLSLALVFKNFGFKMSDYFPDAQSGVPFDVQVGLTVKPEYMPFRFSITGYNLVDENVVFQSDPEEQSSRTAAAFDKVLRRVSVGTDLILNDALQFHFGYNHLRRQELRLDETAGGAGFSYGFSLGVKKLKFRYARAIYNVSGAANFISLETNLNDYKKIL